MVNDPLAIYNVAVIPPFCTSDRNDVTWHAWLPTDSHDVCIASSFDLKHANYDLLSSHLSKIYWPQLFMSVSPDNVEVIWQALESVIADSIKTYAPLRNVVYNFIPRQLLTWTKIINDNAYICGVLYPSYIQRAIEQTRVLWHCKRF